MVTCALQNARRDIDPSFSPVTLSQRLVKQQTEAAVLLVEWERASEHDTFNGACNAKIVTPSPVGDATGSSNSSQSWGGAAGGAAATAGTELLPNICSADLPGVSYSVRCSREPPCLLFMNQDSIFSGCIIAVFFPCIGLHISLISTRGPCIPALHISVSPSFVLS